MKSALLEVTRFEDYASKRKDIAPSFIIFIDPVEFRALRKHRGPVIEGLWRRAVDMLRIRFEVGGAGKVSAI